MRCFVTCETLQSEPKSIIAGSNLTSTFPRCETFPRAEIISKHTRLIWPCIVPVFEREFRNYSWVKLLWEEWDTGLGEWSDKMKEMFALEHTTYNPYFSQSVRSLFENISSNFVTLWIFQSWRAFLKSKEDEGLLNVYLKSVTLDTSQFAIVSPVNEFVPVFEHFRQ